MKKTWMIVLCIVIVLLLAGNCFFIAQAQKPDYTITIGNPRVDETGFVTAVDFQNTVPLKSKDDVDTVLFALLSGQSVEAPSVVEAPPDAVMMIGNAGRFKIAYSVTLWVEKDSVVFAMGMNDWEHYKRIEFSDTFIELINSHLAIG